MGAAASKRDSWEKYSHSRKSSRQKSSSGKTDSKKSDLTLENKQEEGPKKPQDAVVNNEQDKKQDPGTIRNEGTEVFMCYSDPSLVDFSGSRDALSELQKSLRNDARKPETDRVLSNIEIAIDLVESAGQKKNQGNFSLPKKEEIIDRYTSEEMEAFGHHASDEVCYEGNMPSRLINYDIYNMVEEENEFEVERGTSDTRLLKADNSSPPDLDKSLPRITTTMSKKINDPQEYEPKKDTRREGDDIEEKKVYCEGYEEDVSEEEEECDEEGNPKMRHKDFSHLSFRPDGNVKLFRDLNRNDVQDIQQNLESFRDEEFSLSDPSVMDSMWEGCEMYSMESPNQLIKLLAEFEVLEFLGEGDTAKVRRVRHHKTDLDFALKIFNDKKMLINGVLSSSGQVAEKEARLSIAVNNVNIVRVYNSFKSVDGKKWMLLMEYAPYGTAADITSFNLSTVKRIFTCLIKGMECLHSMGITHRDIKPSNIFIFTETGDSKLGDLGSAFEYNNGNDRDSAPVGTPEFLPPECVKFDTDKEGLETDFSSTKADIWMAGVTLYKLIYGSLPFSGENLIELYRSICEDEIKFDGPSVHDKEDVKVVNMLIRGMTEKDPEKRFSLEQIKGHRWIREEKKCEDDKNPIRPRKSSQIEDFMMTPAQMSTTPKSPSRRLTSTTSSRESLKLSLRCKPTLRTTSNLSKGTIKSSSSKESNKSANFALRADISSFTSRESSNVGLRRDMSNTSSIRPDTSNVSSSVRRDLALIPGLRDIFTKDGKKQIPKRTFVPGKGYLFPPRKGSNRKNKLKPDLKSLQKLGDEIKKSLEGQKGNAKDLTDT